MMMMKTACIILVAILVAFPAGSGQSSPPPAAGGCADSVISFSPCLPYISAPPNDLASEPSPQCCDIFNGAFDSDEAECLCYLVRHNSLLGFPLNLTKLLSLSDLCSETNSLASICSGSPTLPPLMATPRKPPSGSTNARRTPPPLLYPPPSTIIKPRPAPSTQNAAATKPSTSDHSNHPDDAFFWLLVFGILYFIIIHQNIAGMGLNQT
ncbi:putative bifunctional inhibitor/plant lipid transfer protein/seed storage helical [Helianthus anomalus]